METNGVNSNEGGNAERIPFPNNFARRFAYFIVAILLLSAGFVSGAVASGQGWVVIGPNRTISESAADEFELITEAWNTIQKVYVDRQVVEDRRLGYGAINGMVESLGDTGHSTFLTPEMLKEQNNYISGEFEGIGALMEMRDGLPTVVTPFDNSPAMKAGVRAGDVIVQVDGEDVTGQPLTQVVSKVLGPAGTQVTIAFMNPQTGEIRELTITRARIQLENVTWQMLPGTTVAHLRVAAFSENVTEDVKTAIREIQAQGGSAIILDLRNNAGGLLDEGIGVASQFLATGNVMLERDAQGETKALEVQPGGLASEIPLVVLINQGTASASEIVSGAIQDAQRGQVIGEKSFGTGTVLNTFRLSDGSALLLATQEWLTPNGRVIWHQGLQPDEVVSLPANVTTLIPESERSLTAEGLKNSQDTQLLRALEILSGP